MKNAILVITIIAGFQPQLERNPKYLLPFPKGTSYEVIQSWHGPWGHQDHAAYAYDFNMPIGSPVIASRSGQVVKLVEEFDDGNKKPGEENFLVIDHGNMTYSRYYHLTKNGVLVDLGSKVIAGDTIALSGNTGASAGPHLHFDITMRCYEWGCGTIEFQFSNASENPLKARIEYTAK